MWRNVLGHSAYQLIVTLFILFAGKSRRSLCKGVPRTYHWGGGKTERLKTESGVGFLGRGQQPPPHQLEGLGERCDLPQQGSGRSLDRPKVFHYFQHLGWPILRLILLIVDYHAASGGGGKTPVPLPLGTPLLSYGPVCRGSRHSGPLKHGLSLSFLPRAFFSCRPVSVRPLHSCIVFKRLNTTSNASARCQWHFSLRNKFSFSYC